VCVCGIATNQLPVILEYLGLGHLTYPNCPKHVDQRGVAGHAPRLPTPASYCRVPRAASLTVAIPHSPSTDSRAVPSVICPSLLRAALLQTRLHHRLTTKDKRMVAG
jgi:hypothetical protein